MRRHGHTERLRLRFWSQPATAIMLNRIVYCFVLFFLFTPPVDRILAQDKRGVSGFEPFEFQFGVWHVEGRQSYPGGRLVPFKAVVRIQPSWQGPWPSIREEYFPLDAPLFGEPSLGLTERVYHAERRAWHMRFRGTTTPAYWPEFGSYERIGDQVVMSSTEMTDATGVHLQRLTITLDGTDAWHLNAERSYNGGNNWFSWVLMDAVRIGRRDDGALDVPASLAERAQVETVLTGFSGSRGIALTDSGHVIIGAQLNNDEASDGPAIVSVSRDGSVRTLATGLHPAGLAWAQGMVYAKAHDVQGGRLVRIHPDGTVEEMARLPGDGLAVDIHGNAYTTDFVTPVVFKTTPSGEVSVLASDERLKKRLGMAFDNDSGRLYLSSWDGNIISVSTDGVVKEVIQVPTVSGSGAAWLAVARNTLFLTQFSAEQVYAYDLGTGSLRVLAGDGLPGWRDGDARQARFRAPNGIAVNATADTVYVAELVDPIGPVYPENRLRRIWVGEHKN